MQKEFSIYLQNHHDILKKIVEELSKKFEYVSILATDCEGQQINVSEKNILVKDSEWNERGFVLRVYENGLFSEYSFDTITTVEEICKKVIESVEIVE